MAVKARVRQMPTRGPLAGKAFLALNNRPGGVPNGLFARMVTRAIAKAASKAEAESSSSRVYRKVVLSGGRKPVVVRPAMKRKAA